MRRIAVGLGGVLLVVLLVAAATYALRFRLTTAAVRYALARAGFPDARFTIERVDREAVVITQVESGSALRVERCEIELAWRRVPRLPVERVRVAGARVDVAATASTTTPEEEVESPPPGGLPLGLVPALELEDAVATIASPIGPLAVAVDSRVDPRDGALEMKLEGKAQGKALDAAFGGEARLDEGGAVSISVKLSALDVSHENLRIAGGAGALTVAGTTAGLGLRNAAGVLEASARDASVGETKLGAIQAKIPAKLDRERGEWLARIDGGDVRLPGKQLHAAAISGEASVKAAKLAIGTLEDTAKPRRFEPIGAELRLQRGDPEIEFSGEARVARDRGKIVAEGRYDASRGIALLDLKVPRTTLGKGQLRLADLSPRLAAAGETSGTLEGSAHLSWNRAAGVTGEASLRLADVSARSPRIRIDGLDGTVKLAGLFPPVTAGIQTLSIREMHPGVLLGNAALRFGLEPAKPARGSRLRIERFETSFAGGKIHVDDTVLEPFAATNAIVFRLEGLDSVALFAIASLEGVTGTGRLSGAIPVEVRGGKLAIPKGELVAKEGVLQIRSQQVSKLLSGGGESVELLLDALEDFHYDELTVTIEKAFEGDVTVRLHLSGQNPAVMNGQPFNVNLNLSGNLDRLIASLLEVARLSDQAVRATVNAVKPEGDR